MPPSFLSRLVIILLATSSLSVHAKDQIDTIALNRVFNYRSVMQDNIEGTTMNVYLRYHLRTDKKNKLLLTVPSMYVLARKNNREFVGETYRKVKFLDVQEYDATLQVAVGTVPRYKFTMPTVRLYLTPKLYDVTLIGDHLLSPFHFRNRSFYRYGVTLLTDQRVEIVFRPRKYNTQLVSGKAIADYTTGRIISVELAGEYDMIRFQLQAEMGDSGELSLVPKSCDVNCVFKYLGNKITGDFHTEANQLVELPDSIVNSHSMALMDSIRPVPLPSFMQSIYHQYDSLDALTVPTTKKKKKNMAKAILWDAVGDNLVNRIKGTFGTNDQGYYRISPILNPLYLGYSDRKGIYYKMKLNGSYAFTENQLLSLNARLGYRFKFHEFYFSVPLRYTYDKEKHGYVELEVGRGNKITSSNIRQQLKEEFPDLTDWNLNQSRLDDFRDSYVKMRANHDISDLWSITAGYTYHRRTAVDKQFFRSINMPVAYHSMAPMIQTQIRPWGWKGPIFTLNYEQGIKGIGKANMEYGRVEFDAIWLRKFFRLRSLSLRGGSGYFFQKGHDAYFLDFENFREDYMPGGWNDDWTGEFLLLNREMYNTSRYYVRANMTYESPLMLMSRLPIVGKVIEMERVYVSGLLVDKLHPYTEWGYGFTNRLFSIGAFVATKNFKYDGIGCRVGLELFRDW